MSGPLLLYIFRNFEEPLRCDRLELKFGEGQWNLIELAAGSAFEKCVAYNKAVKVVEICKSLTIIVRVTNTMSPRYVLEQGVERIHLGIQITCHDHNYHL